MTAVTDIHPDRPADPAPRSKPGRARCYADADGTCPCDHNPEWTPTDGDGCDHGWTRPRPGATTPGIHGPGIHTRGLDAPKGATSKCPTCNAHAQRRKDQTDR